MFSSVPPGIVPHDGLEVMCSLLRLAKVMCSALRLATPVLWMVPPLPSALGGAPPKERKDKSTPECMFPQMFPTSPD